MTQVLECSICDAEISLERDQRSGDLVVCSYCKGTFKLLRSKDKWILSEDYDE